MGDIADMMLDGTLCEACGCYIDDEDAGFVRYCSDQCAEDRGALAPRKVKIKGPPTPAAKPCICQDCGKPFVSKGARRAHRRVKHSIPDAPA